MRASAEVGGERSASTAEELVQALRFVERLFENERDALLAFDGELRFVGWNRAMEVVTGVSRENALGRSAGELFPSLLTSGERSFLEEALDGGWLTLRGPFYAARRGVMDTTYEIFYAPLYGGSGRILGGVTVVRNLQERGELEARLRETETRFRTMADCAPVLLWMSETDGLCSFFNQTWLDFTGRTMEQEIGYGWAEGVHPEDFQTCVDTYMQHFNERRPFEMFYRLRRCDGAYRWILDRGAARYAPTGEFAGYIGSCIDVTEQREAHAELQKLNSTLEDRVASRTALAETRAERLTRSNAALEQFAYAASHDLQEPLRAISGYAQLMGRRYTAQLDDKANQYLHNIIDGTERMRSLLSGLLSCLRLGAENRRLEETDLGRILAEAVRNLEAAIAENEARITHDPLPALVVDRTQVLHLLQNLLSNAMKFRGDDPPHIHVSATPVVRDGFPSGQWQISVRDNGIGIDPEFADRIFQLFQRLHTRERYPGSGVGLALCKQIVEQHGGRIWVESKPGHGSTFHFTLPERQPKES